MTITREQVADLQPGDVVELHRQGWAEDVVVRGSVCDDSCKGDLYLGDYLLASTTALVPEWLFFPDSTLTVVSRAPRPLYVNHPRTEPVPGDVVRDADNESDNTVWMIDFGVDTEGVWCPPTGVDSFSRAELPARLRLLVDGETGQVVQ